MASMCDETTVGIVGSVLLMAMAATLGVKYWAHPGSMAIPKYTGEMSLSVLESFKPSIRYAGPKSLALLASFKATPNHKPKEPLTESLSSNASYDPFSDLEISVVIGKICVVVVLVIVALLWFQPFDSTDGASDSKTKPDPNGTTGDRLDGLLNGTSDGLSDGSEANSSIDVSGGTSPCSYEASGSTSSPNTFFGISTTIHRNDSSGNIHSRSESSTHMVNGNAPGHSTSLCQHGPSSGESIIPASTPLADNTFHIDTSADVDILLSSDALDEYLRGGDAAVNCVSTNSLQSLAGFYGVDTSTNSMSGISQPIPLDQISPVQSVNASLCSKYASSADEFSTLSAMLKVPKSSMSTGKINVDAITSSDVQKHTLSILPARDQSVAAHQKSFSDSSVTDSAIGKSDVDELTSVRGTALYSEWKEQRVPAKSTFENLSVLDTPRTISYHGNTRSSFSKPENSRVGTSSAPFEEDHSYIDRKKHTISNLNFGRVTQNTGTVAVGVNHGSVAGKKDSAAPYNATKTVMINETGLEQMSHINHSVTGPETTSQVDFDNINAQPELLPSKVQSLVSKQPSLAYRPSIVSPAVGEKATTPAEPSFFNYAVSDASLSRPNIQTPSALPETSTEGTGESQVDPLAYLMEATCLDATEANTLLEQYGQDLQVSCTSTYP